MRRKFAILSLATLALSGCTTLVRDGLNLVPNTSTMAVYPAKTQTQAELELIPPPARPVAIAVYGFTDQTGQFKPSEQGQTLSRAVSQGGASILVKALQDVGNRAWFTIVERESLKNLLTERQIIGEMRQRYLGEKGVNPQALPSMLFAGVLLEGGIIGYDSNTVTGGAGAGFLGISARSQYRQDTVTVYLRAVSVRTGEILTSVTASKTIASKSLGGNAFRYVGFKELLQADVGITTNEPDQLALQQAIEKAVYALVMEGVDLRLWQFQNYQTGWPFLWRYRQERAGTFSAAEVRDAMATAAKSPPVKMSPRLVPPPGPPAGEAGGK